MERTLGVADKLHQQVKRIAVAVGSHLPVDFPILQVVQGIAVCIGKPLVYGLAVFLFDLIHIRAIRVHLVNGIYPV